ncbi:MAG: bifunctional diguanylate cyclase/phosphodiesterase [Eubacteriales bacterium]|nr:bifunctional diguanylate cyclase/phosphodiesterase [Eubacteriales bacterium]
MINWSLSTELLSLIIIIMTALFCYDKKQIKTRRDRLFDLILLMSALSILLNTVCVFTIEHYADVPHGLNMVLNSVYFLISSSTCTAFAAYLFDLLLEHVYDKHCRTKALVGLSILTVIFTLLVLLNCQNGLLFYFNEQGVYCRGPLNKAGYMLLIIELGMIGMCYHRNRASIGRSVRRVMYMLPPVALLLAFFQLSFSGLLLNGTIMAFAALIIFVNFQNLQVGQDSLTGIGNRKSFFEELSLRLKGGQKFQILLVSLCGFAAVNQQFGYRKGDEFLYHIAKWLEEVHPSGRAFRFSNVTFALICPYEDDDSARKLLHQLKERFDDIWQIGDIRYGLSACFGLMTCNQQTLEATQIMEMLTMMMEFAKQKEQKEIEYDKDIELMFRKKKWLEELLLDSVEKKRFEVWYQPIFNCKTQQFDAAEALIRLRDYEGHLISPADFIPLAEENGMIEEIGWFVWEEVCRFLGTHSELPLQAVSINMSMQQFMNQHLSEKISDCLERNHLSPSQIKMEITERVVSYDMKYMKQQMEHFAEEGLVFCVDDFGTGYSNLSNVMHLPFACVKLDRSLFEKFTQHSKDRMVVRSMIELFHSMNLQVVAEGIETRQQQELLHAMGVDYIQGFYYAKPMPEADMLEFMTKPL